MTIPKTLSEFRDTYKSITDMVARLKYESDVVTHIWELYLDPGVRRVGCDWKDPIEAELDLNLHDLDLYERACIHFTATHFSAVHFLSGNRVYVFADGYRDGPAGP